MLTWFNCQCNSFRIGIRIRIRNKVSAESGSETGFKQNPDPKKNHFGSTALLIYSILSHNIWFIIEILVVLKKTIPSHKLFILCWLLPWSVILHNLPVQLRIALWKAFPIWFMLIQVGHNIFLIDVVVLFLFLKKCLMLGSFSHHIQETALTTFSRKSRKIILLKKVIFFVFILLHTLVTMVLFLLWTLSYHYCI
jgi:hypothetical protein